LDVIALYTLNGRSHGRIEDREIIVHEPWRVGSKQRSSTTREYLGAVTIQDLRDGKGELATEADFYNYWRKYPFKIGRVVQQQLDKLRRAPASVSAGVAKPSRQGKVAP
jgi:hypothetical protein